MTDRAYWLLAGTCALTLAICVVAIPRQGEAADDKGKADALSDEAVANLIKRSEKIVAESLSGKVDKPAALRARTAALMIAVYAQYPNGAATPQKATLRDAALKLAETIKSEDYDAAKKQAGELANLKPNPAAKLGVVPILGERVKLEDIMNQFSGPRSGGLGFEKKLEDLGEKEPVPDSELTEDLASMAEQASVIGHLVKGKKQESKQKQWEGFADAMSKQAVVLAATARKKDAKAATKAVADLNKACNNCHEVFK